MKNIISELNTAIRDVNNDWTAIYSKSKKEREDVYAISRSKLRRLKDAFEKYETLIKSHQIPKV